MDVVHTVTIILQASTLYMSDMRALFDAVISRAFASLQDMTEGCAHLLKQDGVFLAMKGIFPQEELAPIAAKIDLVQTIKLAVAATEGERHLLVLKPKQ